MEKENRFILWFNEVGIGDVSLVGGKNASLGEMYRNLTKKGVRIPNGFAITAAGYRYFIEKNQLSGGMEKILQDLNTQDIDDLQKKGRAVRELILSASFPQDLHADIIDAYHDLGGVDVAVRSSALKKHAPCRRLRWITCSVWPGISGQAEISMRLGSWVH